MSSSSAELSAKLRAEPSARISLPSRPVPSIGVTAPDLSGAKVVYHALAVAEPDARAIAAGTEFLRRQLDLAARQAIDFPASIEQMPDWFAAQLDAVGSAYQHYLAGRKGGAAPRFFTSRAHALNFLQVSAPTKLVDGAWLAGLLPRWADPDFGTLIRIYLEELGEGVPEKNHVALYRKLITTHACDQFAALDERFYVQGAIQLALAHCGAAFLPELVGFNLGYEQLPLHLLITAFELNELDIDPYYFTLHVTVDNALTGHAGDALQAVRQLAPVLGDRNAYLQRVLNGYRLNGLGMTTEALVASYAPEAELIRILQSKCGVGQNMHSDYCRVGGKTINAWLSAPQQMGEMLQQLERAGWFARGAAPEQSRFWRLLQSEKAEMFGVFSAYEQAVLADWIRAGVAAPLAANDAGQTIEAASPAPLPRTPTYRARQRAAQRHDGAGLVHYPARAMIRTHRSERADATSNPELRLLEQRVAALRDKNAVMTLLAGLMSPALHHSASGMMATRLYSQLLRT